MSLQRIALVLLLASAFIAYIALADAFPTHLSAEKFTATLPHTRSDPPQDSFLSIHTQIRAFKQKEKRNGFKLTFLLLVLLLSGDIESNPGPTHAQHVLDHSQETVFPCGSCHLPVTWQCRGVECDSCSCWYHADCQNISESMYDRFGSDAGGIFTWICLACNNINVTTNSNKSLDSFETSNPFHPLTSSPNTENITKKTPMHTSTPKQRKEKVKKRPSTKKPTRSLKVLVINCRSLVDKKHGYEHLIHSTKADVIIGTESWLKPKHYDNEIFDPDMGYTPYRRDRIGQNGGGVFIAVRSSIIAQEVVELQTDCENLWVKINIVGSKSLLIGAYYKPQEHDTHSLQEFTKSLNLASQTNCNIWVGGDFNMPKMDWENMRPTVDCRHQLFYREFIETLHDNNMHQMVDTPTRDKHILDLFLTNNPSQICNTTVIPGLSDHDTVQVEANISPKHISQKPRQISLYSKADWDGLKTTMTEYHKHMLQHNKYHSLSTQDLWDDFTNTLQNACNKYIPTKTARHKDKLPWVGVRLSRLYRKRDRIYKKLVKSRSPENTQAYKNIKHLARKETKLAYKKYLEDILNTGQTENTQHKGFNSKRLYTLLKHSRQDSTSVAPLKRDGISYQDDTKKATILNDQFRSVFSPKSPLNLKELCKMKLQTLGDEGHTFPYDCKEYKRMPDIDISINGVEKLLNNLNPHKAAGPDNIKPVVLKRLSKHISPIVQQIFQKSVTTGELPKIWKNANVAPVFKKGDKSNPANYRPISLTCILCKTLEHIIASSIVKHFGKLGLFYELQHGFREKRSCETQLVMLMDELYRAAHSKKQVDLILLDFSKAFDKVSHEKLILKLSNYGVRGETLKWVKSFLDNRTQSVVVNGSKSSPIAVPSGVPQGSVLGPLLFLAYINDLPNKVKSRVRLFADDTAIYLAIATDTDAKTLQGDLSTLESWEADWDMQFNPSKCQVIHVTKSRKPINTTYFLHNTKLEATTSAKYLGVVISDDLSWNTHIDAITKKANQTLGFLRRNIKIHSEALKSTVYKTLVRPQLEYCSSVWSPHHNTQIQQIEAVQRRAARWVKHNYKPTASVSNMLHELGWRTLIQRRIDNRLSLCYKIVNNQVAIPFHEYFAFTHRSSRSTHPLALRPISTTTDYYKFSYFPRTITHWNALSPDIPSLPTIGQFNSAVCRVEHKSP